jgi:orotidine-5'-phosphate decarboxylase
MPSVGDIGNTARKYAEAFFDKLDVDAVTLSPYMGRDSVTPFRGSQPANGPSCWASPATTEQRTSSSYR